MASATAAYVVSAMAMADPQSDPFVLLRAGVHLAQEQVALGVLRDPTRTGMATTLSAVATDGERFALAHLGDSRGYTFREGTLTRATHDHTLVQRLVDQGSLAEEDVPYHPWRSVVTRTVNGEVAEQGDLGSSSWFRVIASCWRATGSPTWCPITRSSRSWPSAPTMPRRRRCSRPHSLPAGVTTSPACSPPSSRARPSRSRAGSSAPCATSTTWSTRQRSRIRHSA